MFGDVDENDHVIDNDDGDVLSKIDDVVLGKLQLTRIPSAPCFDDAPERLVQMHGHAAVHALHRTNRDT